MEDAEKTKPWLPETARLGMSRLETILSQAAVYIVNDPNSDNVFKSRQCVPSETLRTLKEAALSSISVLLLGQAPRPDEEIFQMLLTYEKDFVHYLGMESFPLLILDIFPFLINVPCSKFTEVKEFMRYQDQYWVKIKEMRRCSTHESLTKVLLDNVEKEASRNARPP